MTGLRKLPVLLPAVAAALLLGGCQDAPEAKPPVAAVATATTGKPATPHEAGRAIYNFRCYFCHGYSGNAKTLAATYMTPPPRDFTVATPESLPRQRVLDAVRHGVPGSGMKSFANILSAADQQLVADFVFDEFVVHKAENTRYHTPANGWADHERYRAAYPFALGQIALTEPWEKLTPEQQAGRRLYLEGCVTCHDRGRPTEDGVTWDSRPLSYPRNNYDHRNPVVDATTSATPYRLHDVPPKLSGLSTREQEGETLYQQNCAFCHAADGTGKNWIGAFLEPHPRNLTDPAFMAAIDRAHLRRVIRDGLAETSMPAWKSVLSDRQIDAVIAYIDRAFHPVRP